MEAMPHSEETIRQTLRSHGLRNTPQRHAILNAFERDTGEHLSAEEIHGRAASSLPGLSRGTVYAALNELAELGLLSAVGLPEPVRYELNTTGHDHFRCRLCLRLFDLDSEPNTAGLGPPRSVVERVDVRSEGICADCVDYELGLEAGTRAIQRGTRALPWADVLQSTEVACAATEGPLGKVLLAASSAGLIRLAFEHHFDAGELERRAGTRRGSRPAREHLKTASDALGRFLAGESPELDCTVDPRGIASAAEALPATRAIPYAGHASYLKMGDGLAPRELGRWMGANPMPIIFPCHRVSRGKEVPETFVGGVDRRRWLESHEREYASLLPRMRSRGASGSRA
jgi:Fe2+ or Zn2+ uptake regulation protein/O6-methylguanine-DNA--protein-cysteine methyltransferase